MKYQFHNYKGKIVDAPRDHVHVVANQFDGLIVWSSTKAGTHQVRYGLSVQHFTGKEADVQAAKTFGLCVRHAAECDGNLQP